MTKGQLMVRPGDVTVTVHEPVETATLARDAVRDVANHVREQIRSGVDEPHRAASPPSV